MGRKLVKVKALVYLKYAGEIYSEGQEFKIKEDDLKDLADRGYIESDVVEDDVEETTVADSE